MVPVKTAAPLYEMIIFVPDSRMSAGPFGGAFSALMAKLTRNKNRRDRKRRVIGKYLLDDIDADRTSSYVLKDFHLRDERTREKVGNRRVNFNIVPSPPWANRVVKIEKQVPSEVEV
jgi:hypothetical protein